jgi:hypothetical protein
MDGFRWHLMADCEKAPFPLGCDITGDGTQDIVIGQWDGSARGAMTYTILGLGETVSIIAVLNAPDAGGQFVDFDGDGIWELETEDDTFEFWEGLSRRSLPPPKVVLRFQNGRYTLSTDDMARLVTEEDNTRIWITARLVELIYRGRMEDAWALLDGSREMVGGDSENIRSAILSCLARSPYGSEILNWNRCAAAK